MRVGRERLITLALGVLMRGIESIRRGPAAPGADVRLALAVLYGFSRSGERGNYDGFWRNLSDPQAGVYSETAGNTMRMNEATRCFEWIAKDVGAPAHFEYRALLARLARRTAADP